MQQGESPLPKCLPQQILSGSHSQFSLIYMIFAIRQESKTQIAGIAYDDVWGFGFVSLGIPCGQSPLLPGSWPPGPGTDGRFDARSADIRCRERPLLEQRLNRRHVTSQTLEPMSRSDLLPRLRRDPGWWPCHPHGGRRQGLELPWRASPDSPRDRTSAPLQVDEVLINANRSQGAAGRAGPVIGDTQADFQGPLAGMQADAAVPPRLGCCSP